MNRKSMKKLEQPPGSLIGDSNPEPVTISVFNYDDGECIEETEIGMEKCESYLQSSRTTWINVSGVHHPEVIRFFGNRTGIHSLVMEDIMSTDHRPKLEDHDDYLFIVFPMITYNREKEEFEKEQVSIILKDTYVISFQERAGDIFDPVRTRIRLKKGRVRTKGADYLACTLLDLVVDNYFPLLETLDDAALDMENSIDEDDGNPVSQLYRIKKQAGFLNRTVWPLRDVISSLSRDEFNLIVPETRDFFRDVYDHTMQVLDSVDSFRENIGSLMELAISMNGRKLNSIMKLLTLISTVFIPLTFIAGIYGMNFKFMPELAWNWGYFAVLGLMGIVALGMILLFRIKRWI